MGANDYEPKHPEDLDGVPMLDRALVRGLTEPRYTRGQLLKSAAAGAGVLGSTGS